MRRKKYNTNVRNHYYKKGVNFQASHRKPIKTFLLIILKLNYIFQNMSLFPEASTIFHMMPECSQTEVTLSRHFFKERSKI